MPEDRSRGADVPRFPVLNVGISAVTMAQATDVIARWIERRERHYVCVCASDAILNCHDDPAQAAIVNRAGLVAPDGMPLVWLGKLRGHALSRVYGPDLMLRVCERGQGPGWRHFLYGSTPDVLTDLATRLRAKFSDIRIVGSHSPPFRALTAAEEVSVADAINRAAPDLVWVGLGSPKQERWVGQFRPRLEAPVLLAVGAALAFHSGRLRQAPRWMMGCGLEWLFRLGMEPRRLWRRYLLGNPRFAGLVAKQLLTGRPQLTATDDAHA
jgi:N-acetylglucosaminyldiphosphoundecaprenol N-acetyl-beta-D-mannosaminyltransferase